MTGITSGQWEMAVDVFSLCLCCITVFLLFMMTDNRLSRNIVGEFITENPGKFRDDLLKAVRQSESAFNTTGGNNFEVPGGTVNKGSYGSLGIPDQDTGQSPGPNEAGQAEGQSAANRYEEAIRMARKGISVREISERVSLPRGEIELISKLKGPGANSAGAGGSEERPRS